MQKFHEPGKYTEQQYLDAAPKSKSYKMYDGGGLYLLVSKSGSKTWKFKYRFDGRERAATIGIFTNNRGGVSLDEARSIATNAKALVAKDINPKTHIDKRCIEIASAYINDKAKLRGADPELGIIDSSAVAVLEAVNSGNKDKLEEFVSSLNKEDTLTKLLMAIHKRM